MNVLLLKKIVLSVWVNSGQLLSRETMLVLAAVNCQHGASHTWSPAYSKLQKCGLRSLQGGGKGLICFQGY